MNELARQDGAELMEKVILGGDLSKLSSAERIQYHDHVCKSVGLNPLTKPFEYVSLQGKLRLYARRDACDQLRKIHGVSIKVIDKGEHDGLYIVSVGAQDRHGRTDEDVGAVQIAGLRGDARANAIAKAMTKAKRRVTLSICGLGFIDETEADDISKTPVPYDLDEKFPDPQKKKLSDEELGAMIGGMDIDPTENKETNADRLQDDLAGIPLFFLENQEQEPVYFHDSLGWVKEYELQMRSIVSNETMKPRERMTMAKEFEKINEESFKVIPDTAAKDLKARRLTANKKLGVQKNG